MTDIAQLGYAVDSSDLLAATKSLDSMTAAAVKADKAADNLSTAAKSSATSVKSASTAAKSAETNYLALEKAGSKVATGGANVAYQSKMVAMQLSQVAQQTMASGNFIQALAVQLPDMALGFGTVGIAAGILSGVTLPLIVEWFGKAEVEVDDLSTAMEKLSEVQSGLTNTQDILKMNIIELYTEYGAYSLAVRQAATDLAALQVAQAEASLAKTVLESADALDRYTTYANSAFSSGQSLSTAFYNLKTDLGATSENVVALQVGMQNLKAAMTFEDKVAALQQINSALAAAGISASALPEELRNALIEAQTATIAMAKLKEEANNTAAAVKSITDGVPGAGWLDGPISAAANLAATLWDAAKAKAAAIGGSGEMDNMTYGNSDWAKTSLGFTMTGEDLIYQEPKSSKGSSGGGGGSSSAASTTNTAFEALRTQLQSETDIINEWRAETVTATDLAYSQAQISKQEHADYMLSIEQLYQDKMAAIQTAEQTQRLNDTASFFGSLQSIAASSGDNMAKAAATFGAIQATINSYVAATAALATPGITLFGRIAAYASVLSTGLAGVAAIKSAAGSSSSSTASTSVASTSTSGTTTSTTDDATKTVKFNVTGTMSGLVEEIIEQIYTATKDGTKVIFTS